MTHGPRYRVPMRRRREGKTNYHKRLKLILSGKLRLVIRATLRSTIVQVVEAHISGDKIIAQAHSNQLKKYFNWKYNTGNMPASYLTGYLCGLRAKKKGIQDCILDIGICIHKNRVVSAFKGFLDANISVPYNNKFFEKSHLEDRINGTHIKNYAEYLKKNNKEKYEKVFSQYIKNKVDPTKIVSDFKNIKTKIEKSV
ncbi:MAG: 50S ribosomal protein L18 [Promethearchaeota archaeon]